MVEVLSAIGFSEFSYSASERLWDRIVSKLEEASSLEEVNEVVDEIDELEETGKIDAQTYELLMEEAGNAAIQFVED